VRHHDVAGNKSGVVPPQYEKSRYHSEKKAFAQEKQLSENKGESGKFLKGRPEPDILKNE
jgi:hypothetical protein